MIDAAGASAARAAAITKSFGRRKVLDALDLAIEPGAVVGLLGANGAGKTTLLRTLLGLTPADSGTVSVFAETGPDFSPGVRARIAYVPQKPDQFPWLTGQAMLSYLAAFYPSFDWTYARGLIARWKISMRTRIGALSPGQQQRLSLVRALAIRPDLLVLDEPIASLDPATRAAVIEELIGERRARSLTAIFSSHIIGDLERLCSHLAVLAEGKIAAFDSIDVFGKLVRVTLEGEEERLSQSTFPQARLIRAPSHGRRILVAEPVAAERIVEALAPPVRATIEAPGLEGIVTEWMQ
jgi:ABC-2 type transport system ATP-binding protein